MNYEFLPEAREEFWEAALYNPKIQLLTIEGLLCGDERVNAPPQVNPFGSRSRVPSPHPTYGD